MSYLWLQQAAPVLTPQDIAAYLLQNGWVFLKHAHYWAQYQKTIDEQEIIVELPQRSEAKDYPRAASMLLQDLSRIENRPESSIAKDIQSTGFDIVRISLQGSSMRDGRLSLEAGRRVYSAARDMVLAAACSVLRPRSVFQQHKPEEALKYMNRARFGQQEFGSVVLCVESPVPPVLQMTLSSEFEEVPFERKVTVGLSRAITATVEAARSSIVEGSIKPFKESASLGVSANLCEAISELFEAVEPESVSVGFSFAPKRPLTEEVSRQVIVAPDLVSTLRSASSRLREEATWSDADVEGPVIQLKSKKAKEGGEVIVYATIEGRSRQVSLQLKSKEYATALKAHESGWLIRCAGDLERERGIWVLKNITGFTVQKEV